MGLRKRAAPGSGTHKMAASGNPAAPSGQEGVRRLTQGSRRGTRIILYSHDTFGLGHLRRSRALAAALTADDPTSSALILTGSPVAGRFAFPERVDHVRMPGVIKLTDGSYASEALRLDIDEITTLRASLIQSAVARSRPADRRQGTHRVPGRASADA